MRTLFSIILLCVTFYSSGQHLGNFNNQAAGLKISRANIATADEVVVAGYNTKRRMMPLSPALNPSANLTLNLKSLYNIEATDYTAVFNINQVGATAAETTDLMQRKIESIKNNLIAQGFKGKFAVDIISFVPQYEIEVTKKLFSKTYTEVPVGFELQQNLLISYNEDAAFQKILAACAAAEVYNLVKVDYYVDNLKEKYQQLQTAILAELKSKKAYYTALGYDLDNFTMLMDDNKYYHMPKDFYKSYQASENISTQALKQKKGLTKARKPQSYYYDPIPYTDYDVVINPVISKPVIQLGMDIKIIYVPKPKEVKPVAPVKTPDAKVYVLSPAGPIDIKQLPNK